MVIVDTNVLMHNDGLDDLFEEFENIYIPVEVLAELDNLKTKEGEKGFLARVAVRNIKENIDRLKFLIHEDNSELNRRNMIVDDIIIEHCKNYPHSTLVTNDINMEIKAQAFGLKVKNFYGAPKKEIEAVYTVMMTVREHDKFLEECEHEKLQEVPIGQFAQIIGGFGEQFGLYRHLGPCMWDELSMKDKVKNYIYDVEPRDIYQTCAIRSLKEDDFTVITGPAGTGKTLLSLGECLSRMSKQGSVIHIFVNPVKTRDTEQLGYYPGNRDEKLMSSFIGGILSSKCGDVTEVERLMYQGGLKIYPFSDIRGIEINAGDIMYITEAQNLSIDLIKLAIQRCAEGSKLIIEGDADTQVDKHQFEGRNNGLKRVIEVFTGTTELDFGYVHLPIIYRSKMASKAEEL